ncbi:50S ribosome-binding GTPase [Sedimentibacter sp. zth1]|uniref:EutP/PduV family microcompartment system protein n=1 Tax=Sedimentibacter sp. zth1 TaxID=2816908 RepID=UPI001A91C749|nr:EutP/PduV family microcompartment system protein [Sedimentibacter sp. zth1]QSX05618.1 50S ribosome-binding GTPase [Sedimentibacter sp. zth1]
MRKKRIMIIGPSRCGKTTLANFLNDKEAIARRTADIIYGKNTIDVPGAYIENSWMYKHIIAIAQDASHVLILIDQSGNREVYSPGFAKLFNCPVIGVIIKTDLMPKNRENCIKQLKRIGVSEPYFFINNINQEGIESLKRYILVE